MVIGKCTDVFRGILFCLEGGAEERGLCWRIFPWRNLSWRKKNSMKRAQDFLAFYKKTMKNKHENFFQMKGRSSIET